MLNERCRGLLRDYKPSDGTFWSTDSYIVTWDMDNCNWLHMILNPTHRQLWGWQILTEEDGLLLGTRTSQHPPGPHCVFSDSNSESFIFIILLFKFNGITHARGGSISAILHNYTLQQKRFYQNCCILIHEKCLNIKCKVWMHDSIIHFLKPHRPQWLEETVNTFKFKQGPPSPSYIIHGLFALGKQQTEGGNKQWWNVWNPTPYRTVKFEQKFLRPNAIENRSNVPQPETPGKMCSNKEMLRDSEDSIPL